MSGAPILFIWNGEAMEPIANFAKIADQRFVIGQVYRLEQVEIRDPASHRHYFACIHTAFLNARERDAGRWRTSEDMRLWALTHTRFRETHTYEAKSEAEAQRVAKDYSKEDQYCRVEVLGRTVLRHRPMSQSYASMTQREFKESKRAVLSKLAEEIDVPLEELEANAKSVA
jgi:hypothetical protein